VQVNKIHDKIKILQNIILPEQRTKEWYEFRYQLITASNLWKVFGTESQVNSLIYEKCKPLILENTNHGNISTDSPLHWGIKYEPVTIMLYEHKFNTAVGEFGCIPHPKYSFIGASPDGINIDIDSSRYGRMVEIKNIVNREITGIPKDEYWIQTQIQMETCDLNECDFVETRFKEYDNASKFYQDNDHEHKGVILHFIERPQNIEISCKPHYIYMPINTDVNEIDQWVKEQRDIMNNSNYVLFTTIYWYLDEISCVLIQRNRDWFSSAVPLIKNTWDIIVKEREEGYEHRASKKKQRERALSLLSDDGIQTNVSFKIDNPICLIKLDENGNVL
jgi:putative phage-type endonuclease